MGNCWSLHSASSGPDHNSNTAPDTNNQLGSNQFSFGLSNSRSIQNGNSTSLGRSSHSGGFNRVFTLVELRAATKNFGNDTVLGEGGFGRVYKGLIKDREASRRGQGLTIAMKKLNSKSKQGVVEWQSEVNFLGRLSHPNLVKLLGFGREDGEAVLGV
ncbi:hypothetical protein RJT34_00781 [Clitoria ternatea]|uniref:Protein kinase domain-containing protein n=1 Tax=Clitoria ternatea TaxID=43366 RepID=A0AAN9KFM7_CLITE